MILRPATARLLLAVLALSPAVPAQLLDGEWFRATISAKGRRYEPFESGDVSPVKVKTIVNYVQLVALEPEGVPQPSTYEAFVWRQDAEGGWVQATEGSLITSDPGEELVLNAQLLLVAPPAAAEGAAQDSLNLLFNGQVKAKVAGGSLASARIVPSSVFCGGTLAGGDSFIGRPKLKLVRVAPEKLPPGVGQLEATAGGRASEAPASAAPGAPTPGSATPGAALPAVGAVLSARPGG